MFNKIKQILLKIWQWFIGLFSKKKEKYCFYSGDSTNGEYWFQELQLAFPNLDITYELGIEYVWNHFVDFKSLYEYIKDKKDKRIPILNLGKKEKQTVKFLKLKFKNINYDRRMLMITDLENSWNNKKDYPSEDYK